MKNYQFGQSLVPSHEFYLSYDLSACYETSRLVGNMQTVETNAFMIILSFFWGMYSDILSNSCHFWLTFWTIFKRWFSNVNLWSVSIPNRSSYLLLLNQFPRTLICWILLLLLSSLIILKGNVHFSLKQLPTYVIKYYHYKPVNTTEIRIILGNKKIKFLVLTFNVK